MFGSEGGDRGIILDIFCLLFVYGRLGKRLKQRQNQKQRQVVEKGRSIEEEWERGQVSLAGKWTDSKYHPQLPTQDREQNKTKV